VIAAMSCLVHAIATTLQRSQRLQTLKSTNVGVLENTPGTRSRTESLPEVFLHKLEQIYLFIYFHLSDKEDKRRGTKFYTEKCVYSSYPVPKI
jgi:hypothetical protein